MMFLTSNYISNAIIPNNIIGTVTISTSDVCNGDCTVNEYATLIIDGGISAIFQGNITVKPHGKLIIRNGALIRFYNEKGIILEPGYFYSIPIPPFTSYKLGSRLDLDSSVIEPYNGNEYWLGIRGIDYTGTINANGILAEANLKDVTLKRAIIAFKNYQETPLNPIGKPARFFANYVTFEDSKTRAIDLSHSQDVQIITPPSGPPLDPYEYDQSTEVRFTNCEFSTSSNHDVPLEYVRLYACRAIEFKNCLFRGKITLNPLNPFNGVGIMAFSSGFKVGGKNSLSQNSCNFENLNRGIVVRNSNQIFQRVYVGYSKFNCRTSVDISGCYLPTLNSNKFETSNLGIYPTGRFFGIYLSYCRDFRVEGNTVNFHMSSYDTGFVGIVADECGPNNNEIYRNFIQKTNYGIQSIGNNRNVSGSIGLQILCNDFSLNGNAINERFDISSVEGKPSQAFVGMRYIQSNIQNYGSVHIYNSAGNKFSAYNPNPGTPRNYRIHPDNNINGGFKYYRDFIISTEEPIHNNLSIQNIVHGDYFLCDAKVIGSSLQPLILPEFQSHLADIENEIGMAQNLQDSEEALQQTTLWKEAQKRLVDSIIFPYAVKGIKDTTILILEQITQGDEYKLLLADAYKDNEDFPSCNDILDELIVNSDEQTADYLSQLKEVYQIQEWLSDFNHQWSDLPIDDFNFLSELAHNMIPFATAPARAMLGYYEEMLFEPRYVRIIEEESNTHKAIFDNNNVQVYPNPAMDILNIQWIGDNAYCQIIDIYGKVIKESAMGKANHRINISYMTNGLYILKLQIDGKTSIQKFVKQ
ncbi:MAG TPA: T9SS type A sorting domain-containing protein [Edaphocola sp.]|nr:T9SS type A sorting domain-containing protein [Edaphocola sp.]